MKKLRKALVVTSLLSMALVLFDIINGEDVNAKKMDINMQKETKQGKIENIEEQIQELQKQEKTRKIRLQEGELLEEQAKLEEELHPDMYYKQQIEMEIDTIDAAVADMKIAIDANNFSGEKSIECQERIQKYGEILEEYRGAYKSGEYISLEELFKQEHEKISQLHSYFDEKYN